MGTEISLLTSLSSLASGDLSVWVDVSDTSMGGTGNGTNKNVTFANVAAAILASPTMTGTVTAPGYYFTANGAAVETASFHGLSIRAPYTDGTQAQLNIWDDGFIISGRIDKPIATLQCRDSHTYPGFVLQVPSSTATYRDAGLIDAVLATTTDASWKGRLQIFAGDFSSSHLARREGLRVESDGTQALVSFFGGTAVAKPTVSGSKGGNAALGSLLTALAAFGLITDSTS